MSIILFTLFFSISAQASDKVFFTAFDAGEGMALLLQKKEQGLLIDTGPASHTGSILSRIKKSGVKKLDHLILTHLHADHASGLFRVLEDYPEIKITENCHFKNKPKPQDPPLRWLIETLEKHPNRQCAKNHHTIHWSDLQIQVLAPEKIEGEDLNAHSLILLVVTSDKKLLIMGDAGTVQEKTLLKNKLLPKSVDILVVGHHGAEDASHEDFIQSLKPKLSIIPVDRNNFWNRPDPGVVSRLKKYSREVLQTGLSGDIRRSL